MKPRTVEFTTAMLIRKPGCYMGKTALVAKYLSKCYKVQRVSARIFVNYLHIDVTSSACDSDSVRLQVFMFSSSSSISLYVTPSLFHSRLKT